MSRTRISIATHARHETAPERGDGTTPHRSASGRLEAPPEYVDTPLLRRLTYFWMALIIAMLVTGGISANHDVPMLWHSWRGPAMIALSLGVVCWYLTIAIIGARFGWPFSRRILYPYLAIGYLLVALLLFLSGSFSGLVFALMGMSMSMLPLRATLLPVAAAIVLYLYADGLLPAGHLRAGTDYGGELFSLMVSVGIIYALTALIHERYQREHLFRELSEANRRLRLAAAREADLATLRERNRLAREMHDSLGHALVSIAIKLEAAQRLYAIDATRALTETAETTALVRSTMTELRNSLADLRPAALEGQSLPCALAEMAREMERRTGVQTTCSADDGATTLDREAQEALYRIAQEALTNVAKHAHATHAAITLTLNGRQAVLEVADDGVGLGATERAGRGHYGVLGMRERIDALGGVLTLSPRGGGGTLLRAAVPGSETP